MFLESLIERELRFFPSGAMKAAFLQRRCAPRSMVQRWIYGEELHVCWIVAEDAGEQIVSCETGFGPAFSWSVQPKDTPSLGMDGNWYAYLYEAFVTSRLWHGEVPCDFELKGPGERG